MATNRKRCKWAGMTDPLYLEYHDTEWGVPSRDDRHLFEMLVLEGAQAGLSWSTILHKRQNYRRAYHRFDPRKVARYDAADKRRLLADAGIVRNRAKVEAALANARAAAELPDGLATLLWSFAPDRRGRPRTRAEIAATSPESVAMAKDLKKRGFRFVGPTTAYALMQAVGMVDDHLEGCHVPPLRPGR